ncbi:LytTR family DNA-binding domain-containing protein [Tateyamaria sp. SN6-1]|uniref:LytTR family DNA-binding domain-containing protein n=1 Tax=Tateyamaria sp. SN6-1 TaxID=3092148 RepID=UPI0039F62878
MKDSALQLAMRDLRRDFERPALWIALLGIAVVLAVAGAFGTANVLRAVPRVLYWIVVTVLTYGAGALTVNVMRRLLSERTRTVRMGLTGLVAGGVVSCVVAGVNSALFGLGWVSGTAALIFVANTVGVAFVVTIVFEYVMADQATAAEPPTPPALLSRLPVDKRGALISLSAVDHYVEVTTTQGQELVLMRLADAMGETGDTPGLQIHRSHWVARDHVVSVTRGSGKATVHLSDGRDLPVSRANLPALKAHGLVPGGPQ